MLTVSPRPGDFSSTGGEKRRKCGASCKQRATVDSLSVILTCIACLVI
jgi:hypothetical protein